MGRDGLRRSNRLGRRVVAECLSLAPRWRLFDSTALAQARLPVHDYGHSDGCSVTGGYVYRGTRLPALLAGIPTRTIAAVGSRASEDGVAEDHRDHTTALGGSPGNVTSLGEDAAGELYLVTQQGKVLRLGPAG